jgi:hypothetical protein
MKDIGRLAACLWLGCFGALGAVHAADGLTPPEGTDVWPRWHARIALATEHTALPWAGEETGTGSRLQGLSLIGDYYFMQSVPGLSLAFPSGGLRATSGLIYGPERSLASALRSVPRAAEHISFGQSAGIAGIAGPGADAAATKPYFGLGYTGHSLRYGVSLSADIGMMVLNPGGTVRLGRAVGNSAMFEDALREMRLEPVLQIGVSYAF